MRVLIKVCAVAGLFLAATGLAPAAHAVVAPGNGCASGDGYGGTLPCDVDLTALQPVCDGDVPRLQYAVTPRSPEEAATEPASADLAASVEIVPAVLAAQPAAAAATGTVDVTFVNPSGSSVTYTGQPLSGSVLWPGAVVGPGGEPLDWPGWRLVDGQWVVGDEYDWVRPSVEVSFTLPDGRTAAATVAYPPSSPDCVTEPTRSDVLVAGDEPASAAPAERAEVLSATGSRVGPLVLVAGGLLLAGAGAVVVARGRRA